MNGIGIMARDFVYSQDPRLENIQRKMPPRVPAAAYRHATPSGPWPWMELDSEIDSDQLEREYQQQEVCDHVDCDRCWLGYPQSLFGNWTPDQVERSKIKAAIEGWTRRMDRTDCIVYSLDMLKDGSMPRAGSKKLCSDEDTDEFWESLIGSDVSEDLRVRCYFLDNMSGSVLQILGTRFNIEPFFFSSSLNWIPAHFQSNLVSGTSDHITLTVTFLRIMENPAMSSGACSDTTSLTPSLQDAMLEAEQVIDTQSFLPLHGSSDKIVLQDLLAIHMVRDQRGSTIISFHPTREWQATSAHRLFSRVRFAGQSVYWQNIFNKTTDPTFLLLAIVWYSLYAWDEALQTLYGHVCWLESEVIKRNDVNLTQGLHVIRAHLLHWESLLEDLAKVIQFLEHTPNPALEHTPEEERDRSSKLMHKECNNLLSETQRLQKNRLMMDKRLKNVMQLVFSTVNIKDSERMQQLTQAAVRDSSAMKQISYLTMVFLPATFAATAFGMNVTALVGDSQVHGTLAHYLETAIPLTLLTIYLIITFQSKNYMGNANASVWERMMWPVNVLIRGIVRKRKATETTTGFNDQRTQTMDERAALALRRAIFSTSRRERRAEPNGIDLEHV